MGKIGCDVSDCKHCDANDNCCTLEEINVCSCNPKHEKEATMCNSYECQ